MVIYKPGQDITSSTAAFILNPINIKENKATTQSSKNYQFYQEFYSKTNPKGGDILWYHPEQKEVLKGDRGVINLCIRDGQPKNKLNWWTIGIRKVVKQINEIYSEGLYPTPLLAISLSNQDLDESELLKAITNSLTEIKFDVEIYTSGVSSSPEPIEEVSESE